MVRRPRVSLRNHLIVAGLLSLAPSLAACTPASSASSGAAILISSPTLAADVETFSENCDSDSEPRVQRALETTRDALVRDLTNEQVVQIVGVQAAGDRHFARMRAATTLIASMNCSTH